jgi:hypothetical protein
MASRCCSHAARPPARRDPPGSGRAADGAPQTGLLVETLTLPGVVTSGDRSIEDLVGAIVATILPPS